MPNIRAVVPGNVQGGGNHPALRGRWRQERRGNEPDEAEHHDSAIENEIAGLFEEVKEHRTGSATEYAAGDDFRLGMRMQFYAGQANQRAQRQPGQDAGDAP